MLKVKNGELEKMGLLFERYKKRIFGFFYHMEPDRELCEDLVQNTFMRVIKYRSGFQAEGEFRIWLFRIARNVANDHFRKSKNRRTAEINEHSESVADSALNREENYAHDEAIELLREAMRRLPEDRREVLTLSKIEGLKYKDIGNILDCTENSVKTRVFRALRELRTEYEWLLSKV